jgi:hypothetical protein
VRGSEKFAFFFFFVISKSMIDGEFGGNWNVLIF